MVWILIALLMCTLAVRADRYADYEGARMPHYSIEEGNRNGLPSPDEEVERSADAPAQLDYKYEEEFKDKIDKLPMKIEDEIWHKRSKNTKDRQNPIDDDDVENHADVSFRKPKVSRKDRKHRTRFKTKDFDRENRQATKLARSRKIDNDYVDIRDDYYINKIRIRDDNNIDSNNFHFKDTTQKIIRRKPRDRSMSRRRSDNEEMDDEVDDMKRFERENGVDDLDNPREGRRQFIFQRPPPIPKVNKMKHKSYPDYNDYYDMKRVQIMKNKLPDILRKTQASTTETPSTRHLQDITYRRVNPSQKDTESTSKTTITQTLIKTGELRTDVIPISKNPSNMSLAEKSRLSILKKAQRKDNVRNVTWTTKPPVLMQVTQAMQTMVMVERPHQQVQLQAREIFDDSPEKIARAKKLMRRKLVAGARRIHDLTDNWDEMVCDYIDVSLLENTCPSLKNPTLVLPFLSIISSCM